MTTTLEALNYQPVELTFGTSGLRGLVTDMTDLECYVNTAGFLQFLVQAEGLQQGAAVHIGGDLRHSTPRILAAITQAVTDRGYRPVYCGLLPTPALALWARRQNAPCIMVTGSHIPDDRNGIKFYKITGEVLKEDELAIKEAVAMVRAEVGATPAGKFSSEGALTQPPALSSPDTAATVAYAKRYTDFFGPTFLSGKQVVFYEHSSVGRDSIPALLEALGAEVVRVGRSDTFIPIDTENVTPENQLYFKEIASKHAEAFAIVSTDGDSDRPFVIDASGIFHRGDVVGAVVADWLQADFAALPVSASDAVDMHLTERHVQWQHTRIGSPYVIVVMDEAVRAGHTRVMGWEVNGGFLLGNNIAMNGRELAALPTRDAVLPILGVLAAAIAANSTVAAVFDALPQRFTQAGLINNFPVEVSKAILDRFKTDTPEVRKALAAYFTAERGFGSITATNSLDGIRIFFDNGDIAHIRPSNNAPQLRMYSVANNQKRADEIVAMALEEPHGIFRTMQHDFAR